VLLRCRPIASTSARGVPAIIRQLPPILVVEDDPAQAEILRRVLRRARLANPVQTATTVADASAFFDAAPPVDDSGHSPRPVLVLLDLRLPDGSGLNVLRRIRREHDQHAMPVVVLSGSADAEDIDVAFEVGANSYLVKPVAFDALIDTLENLGLPWAILGPESLDDTRAHHS
jgi:DNA-binding response OmpR family regulator